MKVVLRIISVIGLLLTIIPSILVFTGTLEINQHKVLMLIGTVIWFSTAPFWLGKQLQ